MFGMRSGAGDAEEYHKTFELGRKYNDKFGSAQLILVDMSELLDDEGDSGSSSTSAAEQYNSVKSTGSRVILMANSWKSSKASLISQLQSRNIRVEGSEDVFTSTDACREYLRSRKLKRPYYLVHPEVLRDLEQEFPRRRGEDCVIVGLPSTEFDYRLLSKAMKLLQEGKPLIALNMMPRTGNACLGPGPFVSMLSACTDAEPVEVCKPSKFFYDCVCKMAGVNDMSKVVVMGDDIYEDVAGPKSLGMKTILTKGRRYKPGDEKLFGEHLQPDAIGEDFRSGVKTVVASFAVSQLTEKEYMEQERSRSSKTCGSGDTSGSVSLNESRLVRKLQRNLTIEEELRKKGKERDPQKRAIPLPSYIW